MGVATTHKPALSIGKWIFSSAVGCFGKENKNY